MKTSTAGNRQEYRNWTEPEIRDGIAELENDLGPAEYSRNGEVRFSECPKCRSSHPNNPAFSLSSNTGVFYCHDCEGGGHIAQLVRKPNSHWTPSTEQRFKINPEQVASPDSEQVREYFTQKMSIATTDSATAKYLSNRTIQNEIWSDLDNKLKEKLNGASQEIAAYPFHNEKGELVAIQRVVFESGSTVKKRLYMGKKSHGVAILKDADTVIVAEGLETGLSVRQHLGSDHGLIILGDCGNLASLATTNRWAIKHRRKIIIATDNDIGNAGIKAARQVLYAFHKKALIFMPPLAGQDWNDSLRRNRMEKEWL